ncbi:MAG: exodeoxyribonuclease III [Thiotrichaceae bacterium]|nr:exodeoxyribonuclease III [Thiotrichaceae bacterium]
MRIITANTNGIRAASRKGFFEWLEIQQADVVCIQETKAQEWQLTDPIFKPKGYHCYYHDAQKKGYSGVALYCKHKPDEVIMGMGDESYDSEGRYIEARFGNLSVISLYMPSGSAKEERQAYKFRCMDYFLPLSKMANHPALEGVDIAVLKGDIASEEGCLIEEMLDAKRDVIICGDWNIAHTKADIKNWRGNQKRSGFLPEERAWFDVLFNDYGFIDAFRELEQEEHQYTWWSNRGQAWANNTGWRIDYQILTPSLKNTVQRTEIYKKERFSDHSPCIIDYDYSIEK